MIKNTSDFNKQKIELLKKKFTLKDAMKFRSNIRFYKQDDIPSKKVIEEIIQDAHDLIPHKNNMVECNIKVYGPEFAKEKEDLVLSTMCGTAKEFWRKGGQHEHDYKLLKKIYEEWRPNNAKLSNNESYEYNYRNPRWPVNYSLAFNEQVRAPYLLVYTHQPDFKTKSQLDSQYNKSGNLEKIFKDKKSNPNDMDWIIQASMHGITTAYLCAEKGLNASFCRCFFYDELMPTDILLKSNRPKKEITFLLGIGYEDKTQHRHIGYVKEPDYDEIVEWK